MKVLFFSSDNNSASGAFLCMIQLIKDLKTLFNVNSYVVLPYAGTGSRLLDENHISYSIIRSRNWIVNKNEKGIKKTITDLKCFAKVIINLISIQKCKRIIDIFSPDLIHINTTFSYVGAVAAKSKNIPLVWHLREIVEEGMGKKIWNAKHGIKLMNYSSRILCVSNSVKETYTDVFPENKLVTVYDGLDVSRYPYQSIKNNDTINFVCVGNLSKHKGQEAIIRSCKMLRDNTDIKFKLFVIGGGPEEKNYRLLVKRLKLEDCIDFCGIIENVCDYYHKAHFTIINGFKEGFGRVTVEAMLCGSYVIGCDTGGTIELSKQGKYCIIFRHNDPKDLYSKIRYAISNLDMLLAQRSKIREYAANCYSSTQNAESVFRLYNSILNEENKARK